MPLELGQKYPEEVFSPSPKLCRMEGHFMGIYFTFVGFLRLTNRTIHTGKSSDF